MIKKRGKVICIVLAAVALVGLLVLAAFLVFPGKPRFGIYPVEGFKTAPGKSEFQQARKLPLEELRLAGKPVISDREVIEYDWKTHTIKLVPGAEKRLLRPPLSGTLFVVVADGQRCYLGAFWSHSSSILPFETPVIYVDRMPSEATPKGSIRIQYFLANAKDTRTGRPLKDPRTGRPYADLRLDPRIKECLKHLGKLKE